jgi:hypothetical protein
VSRAENLERAAMIRRGIVKRTDLHIGRDYSLPSVREITPTTGDSITVIDGIGYHHCIKCTAPIPIWGEVRGSYTIGWRYIRTDILPDGREHRVCAPIRKSGPLCEGCVE